MEPREKPRIHGRDHLPGGSDPIPGLSTTPPTPQVFGKEARLIGAAGGQAAASGITEPAVAWSHFATDDGTVFWTTTGGSAVSNTAGDIGIRLLGSGTYLLDGRALWPNGSYERAVRWFAGVAYYNPLNALNSSNGSVTLPTLGDQYLRDFALIHVSGNAVVSLRLQNYSGSSKTVTNIFARITYMPDPNWPGDTPAAVY